MIALKNIFFLICLFSFSGFYAAVFESSSSGDWNSSASWNVIPGGAFDLDGIPDENDTLTISGNTIDVPSAYLVRLKKITITSTGILNLISGCSFRFWSDPNGSLLINNGSIIGTCDIIIDSRTTFTGNGTYGPSISLKVTNDFNLSAATVILNNSVVMQSGADITINSDSHLTLNGSIISKSVASVLRNNGILTSSNSNFFSSFQSSSSVFLSNSSTSTFIFTLSDELPMPVGSEFNNLTITGNAEFDGDFTIKGNLVNNGVFESLEDDNTILFDGGTQSISGSGTTTFKKITLNNPAGLTFSSGTINIEQVMESINGTFTNSGASVILKSSSNNNAGMLKVASSVGYSGNITAERYFNASSNGYRMVGSPIEGTTLADWQYPSNPNGFIYCGFTGSNYTYSNCGGYCNVRFYNESNATDINPDAGLDTATNITNPVSPAIGTLIYTSSGVNKLSVTGEPELDDFNVSISKGSADSDRGWNLLSNPYPCTIDWTAFRSTNSSIIDNVRYIYSGDALNYISGSGNVPHSQGFWVKKTNAGTSNLSFQIAHTVASETSFTKSTNGINLPLKLKITADSNTYFDFASIQAGSNFSNNYDPGDDIFKLFSPFPEYAPNIYFLDNQGNELDVTCINNNQSVDLFFDARIGALSEGDYHINFSNIAQFMIGSCLLVEDLYTGVLTDLRQDSILSFTSDTLAPSPRFKLQINVDYDINVTNASCNGDTNALVSFEGSSITGSNFSILQNGIVIQSINASLDSITFENLSSGLYTFQTNHNSSCSMNNQQIIITQPEEVISNFSVIKDSVFLDSTGVYEMSFKNLSSGGRNFNWSFGDGDFSNEENPKHVYSSNGDFTVSLSVDNDSMGLCSDVFSKLINVTNPFLSIDNSNEYFVNINRTNYILYLLFSKTFSNIKIELFDISGRVVRSDQFVNSNNISLDFSKDFISSGIYILILKLDNIAISKKIYF
jgi:PKD repeat protein